MNKAIELIESVITLLRMPYSYTHQICIETLELAVEALEHPRWETPEQHEKRTGEAWPDNGAVYYQKRTKVVEVVENGETTEAIWSNFWWYVETWGEFKKITNENRRYIDFGLIICATEAGPPPEDWKREEN